jgi:hypothetical protein
METKMRELQEETYRRAPSNSRVLKAKEILRMNIEEPALEKRVNNSDPG